MSAAGGGPVETLRAGDAVVTLDPVGGRIRSLRVAGTELLAPLIGEPLLAGCYPMVPWAGRLGDGRLTHEGEEVRFARTMAPHAIHGLGLDRRWEPSGSGHLVLSLEDAWPFGGRAAVSVELGDRSVRLTLSVTATERSFPASLGWHPCFVRTIGGHAARVEFAADEMIVRDDTGLPTETTVTAWTHPVDDCFLGVDDDPVVRWGDLVVTLRSPTTTWVLYDERDDVVCVEPQTAPPDAPNQGTAVVLEPGESLELPVTIGWTRGA